MRKLSKQNKMVVSIIAVLLSLTVGYAIFNTTLNIIGSSSAEGDFSVIFQSVGTINEAGSTNATAVISDTKKKLTITAPALAYPGALVEVPVVIKNNGSLSAILNGITTKGLDDPDIKITYSGVAQDEILSPGEEKSMTIKVLWNRDSTKTSVNLNFNIELNYEQNISGGDIPIPDDQKELFTWDSDKIVSGLSSKGIDYVKANGGKLVIPEGVTEIASANFNPETGEGTMDKGFSPFVIGKIDPNGETAFEKIQDPEINFITSVSLPSTMKKIGAFAFAFTNISGELILPGRLEEIDIFAFGGCDNISGELNIPKSVKTIGKSSFTANDSSLNKITAINVYNTTDYYIGPSNTNESSFDGRPVPNIIVEGEYNLTASGAAGTDTIYSYNKGKLEFIGPNVTSTTMFTEILDQIMVNNGVSLDSIGSLSEDTKTVLNLYLSLTIIGWKYGGPTGVFGSTDPVTREQVKTGFTTISGDQTQPILTTEQADKFLDILDHLQMGLTLDLTGVTTIGSAALAGIVTDTVIIPSSVTSIGERAFNMLIANNFNFGTGTKTIPKSIFYTAWISGQDLFFGNGPNIKNITIPDGTTAIADQAFRAVGGLTSITIPSTVTTIGNRALRFNKDLKTVINKTGKSFDWGLIVSGSPNSEYTFETGSYNVGQMTFTVTK